MPGFKKGDRVQVIREHTYMGRTYAGECGIGSIGMVTADQASEYVHVHVIWESHPANHPRHNDPGRSSNIDARCLKLLDGEPSQGEIAALFGLTPGVDQLVEIIERVDDEGGWQNITRKEATAIAEAIIASWGGS